MIHDLRNLIKNELHPGKTDLASVESAYRLKKLLKGNGFYISPQRVRCSGGVMSEVTGNFKGDLEGSYTNIESNAKRVYLYADDHREISLQNCM